MRTFKRLSRVLVGNVEHQHVAYMDDEAGKIKVSVEANHDHPIEWVDAEEDEMGNIVSPGRYVVTPDPVDGHTHGLEDLKFTYPKPKEKPEDRIADCYSLAKSALECDQESLDLAEESDEFYDGSGQWEDTQRSYLEGLKRACLTLNFTQKEIDVLVGYARQQQTEWRFMPIGGGDQITADIFNYLTKHVADQSNFEMEDIDTFEDAAIGGRGNYNIYVDFSQDMRGDLKIENFPRNQVYYGPHQKKDAGDCEYLFKQKMVSLGKLKQIAPKKWKEIAQDLDSLGSGLENVKKTSESTGDKYSNSDTRWDASLTTVHGVLPLVDVAKKEYRIGEIWQKVYLEVPVAGIPEDDFYLALWGWKSDDIKSVKAIEGAGVLKRVIQKMRVTRFGGKVIIVDENPADLPVDDFYTVPLYAKKKGNKFWGKVEAVKDPQREVNYRRSQMIDIGNKMIAYGYFSDPDTFIDKTEEERFEEISSSPGFHSKLNSTDRPPVQVEGIKFPSELAQMSQLAAEDITSLMNIQVIPEGANDSGKKLMQMQQQKLLGNEFLFDNHILAKKKIGRLLIPLIQKYYKTRAYRILLDKHKPNEAVMLGGQSLDEFTEEDIQEALENADAVKYDLAVSEVSASPTQRALVLSMFTELMQAGQQIPFDSYMKFTDLPESEKNKVIESYNAQQAAAAQAADGKQSAEVEKVMMSKGIITPTMQEKYQIPSNMLPPGTPTPETQNEFQELAPDALAA